MCTKLGFTLCQVVVPDQPFNWGPLREFKFIEHNPRGNCGLMRIDCVFYSTRGQVCVGRSGTELPLRMTGADYYYYYLPVQRPVLSSAMLGNGRVQLGALLAWLGIGSTERFLVFVDLPVAGRLSWRSAKDRGATVTFCTSTGIDQ